MSIFKIALPGHDAKDARLTDEVLDSGFPSPKVSTLASPPHAGIISLNWQSTAAVPLGTTKVLYSFPHGYTQVPGVIGVCSFDNGSVRTNGELPFQYGDLGMILLDSDAQNVNLKYFSIDISSAAAIPAFLMRIRYYVFAERGAE